MMDVFTNLEADWYYLIILIVLYLIIILIIEIKDIKFFNFNLRIGKHQYKDNKNWFLLNNLFLKEFKFSRNTPVTSIIEQIQKKFMSLIVINIEESSDSVTDQKIQDFINKMSNDELKIFLKDPNLWLSKTTKQGNVFFFEKGLKKNKKLYKEILPHLIRVEKAFFKELKIENIETGMNYDSDLYKQFS